MIEITDFEILQAMFKKTATVTIKSNKVILTEPQHPDSKLTIVKLPEDTIILKADAFKSPDNFFNCKNNECKRADYIIIANQKIICLEMKATKASEKEIVGQLLGAQCLMKYCQEIGKKFWQKSDFLKNYTFHLVSVGHLTINKSKTRYEPIQNLHFKENFLKVSYPNKRIEFDSLQIKKDNSI